ncbi:MAG: ribbon-helix-helix protein, CopG family [Acidobacteria bacterium]|nr:ribbon-helix-helix protein, CopG family [Acidobacteriota bacterium]
MERTQIYLTRSEKKALRAMSRTTGQSQSELIRRAIDRFIQKHEGWDRVALCARAYGLWRGREDLPDFEALRRELDRFQLTRE